MTLTLHCPVTGPRSEAISWWRVRIDAGRVVLTFQRPGQPAPEALVLSRALAATIERDGEIVFDSRERSRRRDRLLCDWPEMLGWLLRAERCDSHARVTK